MSARIVILFVLLIPLTPAAQRIRIMPPQTVETQHPIVCAHTRLAFEVDDIPMQRSLIMVREMGAPTIVEMVPWAYVEPSEDRYDWYNPDRMIRLAEQQGITVIVRLGVVPAWARPDPDVQETSLNYLSPDRWDDYAEFVADFAARYRGRVRHIIPWNEPNLAFEWGYQNISPEMYVDFLRVVYEAAHATNPDVIILGGALAPTLEPLGSPHAMDDTIYLRRMYEAGAARYFDALSVHTYGFTLPPDDAPAPDALNFRRYELLAEIMREYGDGDKPVYITETSWNDHPRWIHAVKPGQRVQYTLDALRWAEANWKNVQAMCFWYFRNPTLTRSYPDYFAFVTPEFRAKPIYEAVKAYARGE